jgi:hypothetical protein
MQTAKELIEFVGRSQRKQRWTDNAGSRMHIRQHSTGSKLGGGSASIYLSANMVDEGQRGAMRELYLNSKNELEKRHLGIALNSLSGQLPLSYRRSLIQDVPG